MAAIAALTYRVPGTGSVTQTAGKALIGGPFTLTDHHGRRVTEKDFLGSYVLVYFGFTYCPDVCPTELQVIASALEKLGPKAEKVTPLFITVDPERDTVEQLANYVTNFSDRLVGLTGSLEEVRAAAKAYRVYFKKVEDPNSRAGYTLDHSSIVYLMDPKGQYLAHFSHGTAPEAMAETISRYL
jgi:protein SCO1/2